MPTIKQLPLATSIQASDLLPVSQGGTTRGLPIGALLSSTQAAISLAPGKLLGRVSGTAGGPEPIDVGSGLGITAGVLTPDGTVIAFRSDLASVALTGSYQDLAGLPGLSAVATANFGTAPGTVADGGALATTSAKIASAITIGGAPLLGPQTVAIATASGSSQSDSPMLGASVNIVSSVGAGTGVMLPVQPRTTVVNRGTSKLDVYPPSGGRIEDGAPNVAAQIPPGGAAVFVTADFIHFFAI